MTYVVNSHDQAMLSAIDACVAAMPEANDYFRGKYRALADRTQSARLQELFQYDLGIAGIQPVGKTVFDAGCGSGRFALLFVLAGAKRVEATDMFPMNIQALRVLAERFTLPINARVASVCATDIASASIDIIYCNEAISHFQDWKGFLREASRMLVPGGQILISDWNNGANPALRKEIHDTWEESECGPFRASGYTPGTKNMPYLFRRWMIIRKAFPALSDEDVFQLGMRTVGKGGDELIHTCEEFLRTGVLPEAGFRRGISQSRPEDSQHNEEPIDPKEIVRLLSEGGVGARARAHFGLTSHRMLPLLNSVAARMGRLPLYFAKKYLVFGRKAAT